MAALYDDLMLAERALVCSDGGFPLASSSPVTISGDEVWQVLVNGTIAYVFTYADTGSLHVYDVTDVLIPSFLSSLPLTGVDAEGRPFQGPLTAVFESDHLYIAGMSGHLMVVDVSIAGTPVLKSVYAPFTGDAPYPIARAISVSDDGTTVYLSNSSTRLPARNTFIQVINVTDKSLPVLATNIDLGPYGEGSEIVYDMRQKASYLYIAGQYVDGENAGMLSIYSLTNPLLPQALSVTRFGAMLGYLSLSSTGNHLYINDTASPCHTFIVNVTNKATPVLSSTITHEAGIVSADPRGVDSLCDDLLYFFPEGAGKNWVDVYKVTNKAAPVKIGRFTLLGGLGEAGCGTADVRGLFVADRANSTLDIFVPPLATYLNGGGGGGGGGTIEGSVGLVDKGIPRANGVLGHTLQGSLATISDGGSLNIPEGQSYKIGGVPVGNVKSTSTGVLSALRVLKGGADGRLSYCDGASSGDANTAMGISVTATIAADQELFVAVGGELSNSFWSWSAAGPIYCGANGQLTQSVVGLAFAQVVGTALSPTRIVVNVKDCIVQL